MNTPHQDGPLNRRNIWIALLGLSAIFLLLAIGTLIVSKFENMDGLVWFAIFILLYAPGIFMMPQKIRHEAHLPRPTTLVLATIALIFLILALINLIFGTFNHISLFLGLSGVMIGGFAFALRRA
jgi:hypothetical protein